MALHLVPHESDILRQEITEDDIKQRFLIAFNTLMDGREELITDCRLSQNILCECSELDTELEELGREIEVVIELSRKAIYESAHVAFSQDEFNERNNGYMERHRKATERIAELEKLKDWLKEEVRQSVEEIDAKLVELQNELLRLVNSKEDFEKVANEIKHLRELRQNAATHDIVLKNERRRIAGMAEFLQ